MSRQTDSFSSFIAGITFGVTAGLVAGILLAPKSGEETRKELKKSIDEFSDKAELEYKKAKKLFDLKIAKLKAIGAKLDKEKYMKLIDEVITEIKKDATVSSKVAGEIKSQLSKDWEMTKKTISTKS